MRIANCLALPLAVATALLSTGAFAQATEAGAEAIRTALQSWLDEEVAEAAAEGTELAFESGLKVVPGGDGYKALIPPARIRGDDRTEVALGAIALDLTPIENGWYRTQILLPPTIAIDDLEDPASSGTLTIGAQDLSGVFAPAFKSFMAFEGALEAVRLDVPGEAPGDAVEGEIDRVTIDIAYDETAPGVYDQPAAFGIEGLSLGVGGEDLATIGRIGFAGQTRGVHMAEAMAFFQEIEAIARRHPPDAEGVPPGPFFDELAALIAGTPDLLAGLDGRYEVDDLAVTAEGTNVSIAGTSLGMSMAGLDGTSADLRLQLGLDALAVEPAPEMARFLPTTATLDLGVTSLPTAALVEALQGFLGSAADMGPATASMMSGMQLQQAILQSGSVVRISTLSLENAISALDLEGIVQPDANAAFGVTATADMTIAGLPELIAEAQALPDTADTVQMLTLLQSMGAADTDEAGRLVRTYDIELTQAGQILVNGTDMQPLLQGTQE